MNESKMDSPVVAVIKKAYRNGQEDEALDPIIAVDSDGQPLGRLFNGDYVVFYDIRGEREIQITESLVDRNFSHFPLKPDTWLNFVTMIEYNSSLDVKVAFPPEGRVKNTLVETVCRAGIPVCKISESEKAVHVAYFMNGKNEEPFPGERRVVVPSPEGVSNYSLKPEMSADQVAEKIISELQSPQQELIIANLANVDVVGHNEDKAAAIKAVESVDEQLGKIVENCRKQKAILVVTADHGTVEEWLYPDGQINTGHTNNRVPLILLDFSGPSAQDWQLQPEGDLPGIAPTVLDLLNIEKPREMTADSLIMTKPSLFRGSNKVLLLILDGWGLREETSGNLIREAHTPNFDSIWTRFPHAEIEASGAAVGMPAHTVGNSESGHLHLGSGRRIPLDRVKIDQAIETGAFFQNESFLWAMKNSRKEKKSLHLLGIVSHYSSHGTIKHLFALLRLAKMSKLENVYIHALIGRRGEKPESGAVYVAKVEEMCRSLGIGQVVTVMGRFWALDREQNWDRIQKTYRALIYGEGAPAGTFC